MKKYISIIIIWFFYCGAYAQNIERCGLESKSPMAYENYKVFQKELDKSFLKYGNQSTQNKSSVIITIPVHVIIVHNPGEPIGSGNNLSMDHIMSQIDVLNEDFRRLNTDASNTPDQFPAGDTEIEFCLAMVDPDGNPTDGVTRYATTQNMSSNEFSIKSATGWPRDTYLNMWSAPNLGSLLGWAYLPSTGSLPNPILDGTVIATSSFGGPGYATHPTYNLGRTATHEVGHYLGLRHIWRSGGCGLDDGIADTPVQDNLYFGCPNHPSPSCGNDGDMFMNYMDYVDDDCMNAFTVGQGNYMQTILNTSRSSLLDASNMVCTVVDPLEIIVENFQDPLCFGDFSGTIEVSGLGGVPPYEFSINSGPYQQSPIFGNLSSGTYVIEIIDFEGNTNQTVIVLSEPEELMATSSVINNVTCFGEATGQALIQITGGTQPYFVNGNPSGAQYIAIDLDAENHQFNISDVNNCQYILFIFISEPSELSLNITNQQDISCYNQSDGIIEYVVTGGIPPYSMNINDNNVTDNPITNLSTGTYSLVVIDNSACSDEVNLELTEPEDLIGSPKILQHETCLGNKNGIAEIVVSGGTAPIEYSLNQGSFIDSPIFNNLAPGDYQVIAKDVNDCTTLIPFVIDQGYELEISIIETQHIDCGTNNSGSISFSVSNGIAPFSFAIPALNKINQTGIFSELPSGNYIVQVTDGNNCTTSKPFVITETSDFEINVLNVVDVNCAGQESGLIEVSSNSNEDISYEINGKAIESEGIFENLASGSYTIIGTNNVECSSVVEVTIEENTAISIESTISNPTCFAGNDGHISLEIFGGSSPYEVLLNGEMQEDTEISNLSAGQYSIEIIDHLACETTYNFELIDPIPIEISIVSTDSTSCFGNNDGAVVVEFENSTGIISSEITNEDGEIFMSDMLLAGAYTYQVTDENGCTAEEGFSILDASPIEMIITDQTDANCDGTIRGTASFQAYGGTEPYTYQVGQNMNTTGEFDNFNAGIYELIITDNTMCERVIEFEIFKSDAFNYEHSVNNVLCAGENNGVAVIEVMESGSFEYVLDGITNTSGIFEGLSPGIYPYSITDENNCTLEDILEISEPDVLEIISLENSTSNGLSDVIVHATGGSGDYEYSINKLNWQTDSLFTGLVDEDYTFYVQDKNSCLDSVQQKIVKLTEENIELTLLPNPANNVITLKSSVEIMAVDIYNLQGQNMGHFSKENTNRIITLPIDYLTTGMYILRLNNSKNIKFIKL